MLGCGETRTLTCVAGEVNGAAAVEDTLAVPPKAKHRIPPGPRNPAPRQTPQELEQMFKQSYTSVHGNVLDNSPKWRQRTRPPGDEQRTECGLTHTMEGHSATETEAVLTETTRMHLANRTLGARSRSRRPRFVQLLLQKHPGAGDAHTCLSGAGGQEDFTRHRASLWDNEAVPIRCSDRNYTML